MAPGRSRTMPDRLKNSFRFLLIQSLFTADYSKVGKPFHLQACPQSITRCVGQETGKKQQLLRIDVQQAAGTDFLANIMPVSIGVLNRSTFYKKIIT